MTTKTASQLRPALAVAALAVVGTLPIAAHAQQVARDAATGQLRAVTASEAAALNARPAARLQRSAVTAASSEAVASEVVTLPNGAQMAATDESHMVYSVARRNADGTITRVCVQGADAAQKAAKAPQSFAKRPMMTTKTTQGAGYELK